MKNFNEAVLMGQSAYPKGVYYDGDSDYEKSTKHLIDLSNEFFSKYKKILLIDIHTGYGPTYQMSIVNSVYEKNSSEELMKHFNYPLVQKANAEEFYAIQGDMIDYLYKLLEENFNDKDFYNTVFEFGTYGDSLLERVRSLKAIIEENRLYNKSSKNENNSIKIRNNFRKLFYPKYKKWTDKAVSDFKQAIEGVLKYKDYINAKND